MKNALFLILSIILAVLFGIFYNYETIVLITTFNKIADFSEIAETTDIIKGYYLKIIFTSIWFFILEVAIFLAIKLGIKKEG
ncbi:MAG TPA: hypothetical protein GX745_01165 [Clostridiales bacterium]|jgi:Na+/H+-translocating membrane pyrophosphatase|nr:hypothetical protein [Clostridiales bacterium]